MSGWNGMTLEYELTPSKASFYLRRDCSEVPKALHPVTYFLQKAGLKGVRVTRRGWVVHATIAQVWYALSGEKSGHEAFRHTGKQELIDAGLYVDIGECDDHAS
jgi:hypothetical protein